MSSELRNAVQIAVLEKAHRQAIEDVMQSDLGDVERVVRILAMEAEHLGMLESLRAASRRTPAPRHDIQAGQGDGAA